MKSQPPKTRGSSWGAGKRERFDPEPLRETHEYDPELTIGERLDLVEETIDRIDRNLAGLLAGLATISTILHPPTNARPGPSGDDAE